MSKKILPNLGGYITESHPYSGKNRRIEPNGLFSQQIFGPIKKNECECKYYTGILYKGKTCPRCNVLCGSSELRSTQFGKIRLVFPIIKPTVKSKFLKLIKGNKFSVLLDPSKADYNSTRSRYLAVSTDLQNIKITEKLGVNDNYLTIPFCITGIYSLYLCLKFLADKMNVPKAIEIFDKNYISHELKVLPPDLRIMTYDNVKNKIHTPDINKHYTSIIKTNKRCLPISCNLHIDENDWIEKIRSNLKAKNLMQDIVDPTVIDFDQQTAIYQYYVNNIYELVFEQLSGRHLPLLKHLSNSGKPVVYNYTGNPEPSPLWEGATTISKESRI